MKGESIDPKDFLAFGGGIMLIWGGLYFVGQLLFGDWEDTLIGLLVTGTGGWLVYVFLIKKADRADLLEGEHDASEGVVMTDTYEA